MRLLLCADCVQDHAHGVWRRWLSSRKTGGIPWQERRYRGRRIDRPVGNYLLWCCRFVKHGGCLQSGGLHWRDVWSSQRCGRRRVDREMGSLRRLNWFFTFKHDVAGVFINNFDIRDALVVVSKTYT